jgi:hypothetical protein
MALSIGGETDGVDDVVSYTRGESIAAEASAREYKMHAVIAIEEVCVRAGSRTNVQVAGYWQWVDIKFGKLRRTKQPISKLDACASRALCAYSTAQIDLRTVEQPSRRDDLFGRA